MYCCLSFLHRMFLHRQCRILFCFSRFFIFNFTWRLKDLVVLQIIVILWLCVTVSWTINSCRRQLPLYQHECHHPECPPLHRKWFVVYVRFGDHKMSKHSCSCAQNNPLLAWKGGKYQFKIMTNTNQMHTSSVVKLLCHRWCISKMQLNIMSIVIFTAISTSYTFSGRVLV